MKYQSVVKLLAGFWATPWNGLTFDQQRAWIFATLPARNGHGEDWDSMPTERRLFLAHLDETANGPLGEEYLIYWYNETMDARAWLMRPKIEPAEAATLLCRLEPSRGEDPLTTYVDGNERSPEWYRKLKHLFESVEQVEKKPRTLLEWRDIAERNQVHYHSWVDEYLAAVALTGEHPALQLPPSTVTDSGCQADNGTASSGTTESVGLKNQANRGVDRNVSLIIRKRKAMVGELSEIWPTIERDLSDAARGGLSVARIEGRHGYWNVEMALAWAAENGKITKPSAKSFLSSNPDSVFSATLKQIFDL